MRAAAFTVEPRRAGDERKKPRRPTGHELAHPTRCAEVDEIVPQIQRDHDQVRRHFVSEQTPHAAVVFDSGPGDSQIVDDHPIELTSLPGIDQDGGDGLRNVEIRARQRDAPERERVPERDDAERARQIRRGDLFIVEAVGVGAVAGQHGVGS